MVMDLGPKTRKHVRSAGRASRRGRLNRRKPENPGFHHETFSRAPPNAHTRLRKINSISPLPPPINRLRDIILCALTPTGIFETSSPTLEIREVPRRERLGKSRMVIIFHANPPVHFDRYGLYVGLAVRPSRLFRYFFARSFSTD